MKKTYNRTLVHQIWVLLVGIDEVYQLQINQAIGVKQNG